MTRSNLHSIVRAAAVVAAFLAAAWPVGAADTVTVASVTATATPCRFRSTCATPVGRRSEPTREPAIESRASRFRWPTPRKCDLIRDLYAFGHHAGTDADLRDFSVRRRVDQLLGSFSETNAPIPFTLNEGAPGNEVARLTFTLSASATPNSTITLALDGGNTSLSNQGGTVSESDGAGLTLVDGSITIPPLSLTLGPGGQTILKDASADFMAMISSALATSTLVTLAHPMLALFRFRPA